MIAHVLTEYRPDLLPVLSRLHRRYAQSVPGLPAFPPEHWEAIFARADVDPRRDVLIAARSPEKESEDFAAFCWLFTKSLPVRVVLRGPYLAKDDPDRDELMELLFRQAARRADELGAGYLESRSVHPEWAELLASSGFACHGAYERWRLFPLRGASASWPIPEGGDMRCWKGLSDLPVLMGLFEQAFSAHWDYIPPSRESWEEVVRGKQFDPRLVVLAGEGGIPVGYAFGEPVPDPQSSTLEAAYLISFAVRKTHRRRGWAKALLWRWLRNAYDSGRRAAELDVDEKNEAAKILYGSFGFHYVRTEAVWRLELPSNSAENDTSVKQNLLQRSSEQV